MLLNHSLAYMYNLRIKEIAVSLLTLVLGNSPQAIAQTPAVAGDICPGELGAQVDAIANRPEFSRSRWGILIQPLSSTATLYSRDAQNILFLHQMSSC